MNGPAVVVSPLRGIAHVNLLDTKKNDCGEPDVVIKEGGLNDFTTKIEVCSKSGCPLDSILYFYAKN